MMAPGWPLVQGCPRRLWVGPADHRVLVACEKRAGHAGCHLAVGVRWAFAHEMVPS